MNVPKHTEYIIVDSFKNNNYHTNLIVQDYRNRDTHRKDRISYESLMRIHFIKLS